MSILNRLLMDKVSDGDLQTRIKDMVISTTLQEMVTVGDMEEFHRITEARHE